MKTMRNQLIVIGLIVGALPSVAAANEPDYTLSIMMKNYSSLNSSTLQEAEEATSAIFWKAGVTTRWIDGDAKGDAPSKVCCPVSEMVVTILSEHMAQRGGLPKKAMGLAPGAGPDRTLVYIVYNRVDTLFRSQFEPTTIDGVGIAARSQILGCVIAHELGHVLLNLEGHTETGIMRGEWNSADLVDIEYGRLLFSKDQAQLMGREMCRRARATQIAEYSEFSVHFGTLAQFRC